LTNCSSGLARYMPLSRPPVSRKARRVRRAA
jgi:hypothetical protein